jgi:hypothetical protein
MRPVNDDEKKERRMLHRSTHAGLLALALALLMAACAAPAQPGKAIEAYLAAIVAKDDVRAIELSCAAWEAQAKAEGEAFATVDVTLEDAVCQTEEQSGDTAVVSCTGRILFSYDGGETETLDLEGRLFETVLEGGEWRMCGYHQGE